MEGLTGDPDDCDEVIEYLVDKHPELQAVTFGSHNSHIITKQMSNITDRGLHALFTAPNMKSVNLFHCAVCSVHSLEKE